MTDLQTLLAAAERLENPEYATARQDRQLLEFAMATRWCSLDGDAQMRVSNLELIPILAIHDSQANVVRLSRAIHRAASGDADVLQGIGLYGDSPIDEEETRMQRERPTREQIQNWVGRDD